jgi:uncharacterized alpha-E superfamily protein
LAAAALDRAGLPGSMPTLMDNVQRAAAVIRDRLAPDAWRALADTAALFGWESRSIASETLDRAEEGLRMLAAFSGLAQENMNRMNGWRFLELGRRIERALSTCRFARAFATDALESDGLDALLELADSRISYRIRYVMVAARPPVLDLVLFDPNNPRSVAFQVERMHAHLDELPAEAASGLPSTAQRLAMQLDAAFKSADPVRFQLDELKGLEAKLMKLSDEIARSYFTPGRAREGEGGLA